MLNENIKNLRKANGYSQETFANQLNVVRQTVSKWEKGLSVPDAVTLEKMAEIFEVSVSELLGRPVDPPNISDDKYDEIAKQLAILNEQIANKENGSKKRWTTLKIVLFVIFFMVFIGSILAIFGAIFYMPVSHTNTYSSEVIQEYVGETD